MKKLLPFVLLIASGCSAMTVPGTWVAAERARKDAIAPEYQTYYQADANLTAADKARRDRTLTLWEKDVSEHEAAVKAGGK